MRCVRVWLNVSFTTEELLPALSAAPPPLQILCGRLRVMAQPHVREPPPLPAQPPGAAVGGAGNQAPPAVAAAAAAAGGAGGGGPGGAAAADAGHSWVPDVMRCRWRHDPAQARLLPRLRANLRAMAILTVVLAGALHRAWGSEKNEGMKGLGGREGGRGL